MLDGLAAQTHGLRVSIETLLHGFEHVLVLPSAAVLWYSEISADSSGTPSSNSGVASCHPPHLYNDRSASPPSDSDRHPLPPNRLSPVCRIGHPPSRPRSSASARSL